jgi:hypothetical protein
MPILSLTNEELTEIWEVSEEMDYSKSLLQKINNAYLTMVEFKKELKNLKKE